MRVHRPGERRLMSFSGSRVRAPDGGGAPELRSTTTLPSHHNKPEFARICDVEALPASASGVTIAISEERPRET
jgi:hypothetical protein